MDLIFDDVELLLKTLWRDFTENLRNLCLAKCYYSFILEVSTKWDFDEPFIRCDIKDDVIIVKLSL